ncbi:unnamed protein product [Cochlearia groenlandica]
MSQMDSKMGERFSAMENRVGNLEAHATSVESLRRSRDLKNVQAKALDTLVTKVKTEQLDPITPSFPKMPSKGVDVDGCVDVDEYVMRTRNHSSYDTLEEAKKDRLGSVINQLQKFKKMEEDAVVGRRVRTLAANQRDPYVGSSLVKRIGNDSYNPFEMVEDTKRKKFLTFVETELDNTDYFISDCVKPYAKMIPLLIKHLAPADKKKRMSEVAYTFYRVKIVLQNHQVGDCGVYTLKFTECLALGHPMEELCTRTLARFT